MKWPRHIQPALVFDASRFEIGSAAVLPAGFAIACATSGRAAQTSATTYALGFTANAARIRSVDGVLRGVSIESARTYNAWQSQTQGQWFGSGGATITNIGGHAGPDGALDAALVGWTAGNDGAIPCSGNGASGLPHFVQGNTGVFCAWVLGNAGTGATQITYWDAVAGSMSGSKSISTSGWTRIEIPIPTVGAGGLQIALGDTPLSPIGAGSAWITFAQAERNAAYASDYFPTTGAAATRAADTFSVITTDIVASLFPEYVIRFRPRFASGEAANDVTIIGHGGMTVTLSASTKRITLHTGAALNVVSPVLSWSRNQTITVRAMHSRGGRLLAISGATSGNGETTGGADTSITDPGTSYVMCASTGAQECFELEYAELRDAG